MANSRSGETVTERIVRVLETFDTDRTVQTASEIGRRAIAMAHYLDPGSERLSRLPPEEVRDALKRFGAHNPFLHPEAQASKERI